jgi:UDP-N-acetylglucosamine 4,6-dehydratase
MLDLNGSTILLTGATGSFGNAFVERVTRCWPDAVVRVYSRDELKQWEMRAKFGDEQVRYLIGDVRDRARMTRAVQGADIVVHAAAMKQVTACEYNPFEAVRTNVLGAQHVVDAAIDANAHKVVALSTDKAVNPVNLYGATKPRRSSCRATRTPPSTRPDWRAFATATSSVRAARSSRCSGSSSSATVG